MEKLNGQKKNSNIKPFTRLSFWISLSFVVCSLSFASASAQAAAPVGADTFELTTSPTTGGDNTGDGGTGVTTDLNYYYVGQSFTTTMRIVSGGTDAANIWVDYNVAKLTASVLTNGTYFPNYAGATISGGRVNLTGFRTSGTSSGTGIFGSNTWTVDAPGEAAYATGTPSTLDVNVGTIGATTESNISLSGLDILDDEEDFSLHLWADTIKPFAENPSPANAATAVSVSSNYTFDLRDTKNGEGDNVGVGTGVSTTTPPGVITADDDGGADDMTAFDAYVCSGVWGTNLCGVTVNPPSPLGIGSDTRNWLYNTAYTIDITGFRDLASPTQNQLGDANGPNTMNPKSFTFTTEADTVPPQVVSETPTRSSTGNSISTNITVIVHDKKTFPGTVSGTGVVTASCQFNVSSPSFALTTFDSTDPEVAATLVDFGVQYVINPASNFAQNETVSISAFDCEDVVGNTMVTDVWTFSTSDSDAPFVDGTSPSNDGTITSTTNILFHVKDNGTGVNLSNVVVFVNGDYYTNGGGAGSVTTTGTKITFASSLDFNGGNYLGDTTDVTGSPADFTFTIDPASNFTDGEAVPVIVYAKDLSGNIMERVVFAVVIDDGIACVPGSGGGGGSVSFPERLYDVDVTQVDGDSVIVSWSSYPNSTSRVVYGTFDPIVNSGSPNFGFATSTVLDGQLTESHSVIIDGLTTGTVYTFMPVGTTQRGNEMTGERVKLATRPPVVFQCPESLVVPACPEPEASVPVSTPVCPAPQVVFVPVREPAAPSAKTSTPSAKTSTPSAKTSAPVSRPIALPAPAPSEGTSYGPIITINDIGRVTNGYRFSGRTIPGGKVTFIVY